MPPPARITSLLSVLLLASVVGGCGGDEAAPSTDAQVVPASNSTESSSAGRPTAQVAAAKGVELRAAVKQYVVAIEACAASTTDGSYTGCLDSAVLLEDEPSLAQVPGVATVTPGADPAHSYSVSVALDGMTFTEVRGADFSSTKTCSPADAPGCTAGAW